jgi:uncharacterized protein
VFLDANVLFLAAKSDGAVRKMLQLLLEMGHEVWVDDYVIVEARRNLAAKEGEAMSVFEALLKRLRVSPVQALESGRKVLEWLAEKDRPVLAAAIRLRCDALVTGDRTHFGAGYGKVFGGVTIHSPRSLAELLLG